MGAEPATLDFTEDAVLGGRLRLRQPRRGHRVGHDAILLAAATAARSGEHAFELGAGVGAAGLALALRVPGLTVTLAEIDAGLCALAAENARLNRLDDRVKVLTADVRDSSTLKSGSANRVLMNPPFNDPARLNVSPQPGRRLAYTAPAGTLPLWVDAAARLLQPSGTLTMIWRADEIADVLKALEPDFGGIAVLPVLPRPDAAAIRVLVRAEKGSRKPLVNYPGLVLNDSAGRPAPVAESVLRNGEALSLANC